MPEYARSFFHPRRYAVLLLVALACGLFWVGLEDSAIVRAQSQDLTIQKCSICHAKQSYKRTVLEDGSVVDLHVDPLELSESVHHNKTCTDCHADIDTVPHENYVPEPVDCQRCHYSGNPEDAPGEAPDLFAESVHGRALENGVENAPRCQDCHGSHRIVDTEAPGSPFQPLETARTCGKCHRDAYRDWNASEHSLSLHEGNLEEAPTCISCHGEHDIFSSEDERSHTFHSNVPESCAKCHDEMQITAQFDVEHGRVETFERSFHGLALRFGSTLAANCASCHGHHKILHSENPDSMVHVSNIPQTCGQEGCHPGAGVNFSIGKIHVNPEEKESGIVYWIALAFKILTISVITGLVIHILLDLTRRILKSRQAPAGGEAGDGQ